MPERNFEYDVFLSHAGEDTAWCEELAERLRHEGVRVWFDKWEMQPGDHVLAKINEGIAKSRKMVAVWSANYFRDGKIWTLLESFSQQHGDPLSQDRPIIPLMIADCDILPTFRNILSIDFRNKPDFDLRLRQLLQALDFPRSDFLHEEDRKENERETVSNSTANPVFKSRKNFEEEVATLYRLLGFEVKHNLQISGAQIDLMIEQKLGGRNWQAVLSCHNQRINLNERDHILAQQNIVQRILPRAGWISISAHGFTPEARLALEATGVDCTTYTEILQELVPLGNYVKGLITDYETWVAENWRGEDWYIRPYLLTDITYEKQPVLQYFAKWLGEGNSNLLLLLGDLGTGKSTLARFLAYHLAQNFESDPLRHPAPVLIPLKEVRKENSLESMIISHFSKAGLPAISFPRFEHLVRLGKVILLFDAFDEMADRVRWEEMKSNFSELRRAAEQNGKVVLTCRTHYFKDRNEQVKLVGLGPTLSQTETELYRELRQRSGADVVYLQTFEDPQIEAYLQKARPQTAAADWKKIQTIYNLKELAQRPMLLELIVKSLPSLAAGQSINAASLYQVYTNIWIDREEQKGRLLDRQIKLQLMLELAWRLWHEEKEEIHSSELIVVVQQLAEDKVIALGESLAEDIAREMQTATFLKRDEQGNFSFIHRSFMEFFLARSIQEELRQTNSLNPQSRVLNTRRFDRKVIFFLTLLNESGRHLEVLKTILTTRYQTKISENALQILYWHGRFRAGMEDNITNIVDLQNELALYLPPGCRLNGASLQEIVLEGADLSGADFSRADLTNANLCHTRMHATVFREARLCAAKFDAAHIDHTDFSVSDLDGASFDNAELAYCNFRDLTHQPATFTSANLLRNKGPIRTENIHLENLSPTLNQGHALAVNVVVYSPDGQWLASAGGDGTIILYRTKDYRSIRILEGHRGAVTAIQFTLDSMSLASASTDNKVNLWDIDSGQIVRSFRVDFHDMAILSFSFDAMLLVGENTSGTISLWQTETGELLQTFERVHGSSTAFCFSTNSKTIAIVSENKSVYLWEIANRAPLAQPQEMNGVIISSLQFSPDGSMMASAMDNGSIRLGETTTNKMLRELKGHKNTVRTLHFSTDGQLLASGSLDKSVRLWEIASGKMLRVFEGHQTHINTVSFSPDKACLASAGADKTIRCWDLKSGKASRVLSGNVNTISALHISANGKKLAAGGLSAQVKLWELDSSKNVRILEGHRSSVEAVQFSADGLHVASASSDKSIRLWAANQTQVLRILEGHEGTVTCITLTTDGQKLASGGWDKSLRIWDVKSGRMLRLLSGHQAPVRAISFSADALRLASAGDDRTIRMWAVNTGVPIRIMDAHQANIWAVNFSVDGQLLASGSQDHDVRIWSAASGQCLHTLSGHCGAVWSVQFAPNEIILASASSDHTVRLWEVDSGKCQQVLEDHLGPVYTVCFAPNGKYLVAAGAAGRLQFWDHEKGKTFLYRYAFGPGAWLDLLPDGRFDASPEGMRYLCYTEQGTLNSFTAEELVKEFYDPQAVQATLAKFIE